MFNLISFIKFAGYLGVGGVIFAESGLLIGFFLPGDSLLFTAGLLAAQGYLNVFLLIAVTFTAAVAGDSVGYMIGRKAGDMLFTKKESFWFRPDHVKKAQAFFEKHGAKTIILARFLPIIRTFVPVVAGIGTMKYRAFLLNNVIGGLLWAVGVVLIGFYLGKVVPNIDHYLLPIIILIIGVSLLPTIVQVLKDQELRVRIAGFWKKIW